MVNRFTLSLFVLLVLVHLYVNIRLTVDIVGWVPEPQKRNAFLCLVWLLPVFGAIYVYRRLAPDWLTPDRDSGDNQSTISAGLMGLDVIFNPGSRNISEAQRRGEITIKAEGEMYDRDLPDFIDVEAARKRMKDAGDKPE